MVLPDVQGDPSVLQFVPTAFCPGAGHHWHELGFILSAPSYPLSQLGDVLPVGSLFDHLPMKISSTKRLVTKKTCVKHSAHALSTGQIGSFYRSWALPFTNCQLFYGPPNCHRQGDDSNDGQNAKLGVAAPQKPFHEQNLQVSGV